MSRFRAVYRDLNPDEVELIRLLKGFAEALETIVDGVPDGRYKALAMTSLEETVMWAVKGLTG